MDDIVIARIRTWWPIFLGHIVALLVAWLAAHVGLRIDSALAFEVLGGLASLGVWELGRLLERSSNSKAQAVGRWLLALGAAVGPPSYGPKTIDGEVGGSTPPKLAQR